MLSFVMANATENRCRLCLVTPPVSAAREFLPRLAEAVGAGDVATLIVTDRRGDPGAQSDVIAASIPIAHAHGVVVIVADRLQNAASATADGVQIDGLGPEARGQFSVWIRSVPSRRHTARAPREFRATDRDHSIRGK